MCYNIPCNYVCVGVNRVKERYRTVSWKASDEIVEKRSRFIATVKPVETEDEAIEFLEDMRKKYWDARHNVYAYIIENDNIQRYSDDSEPAGTAGVPVLDVLRKEQLSNVIVVVTRYFGGILLGTGGLVHAYSKAAKAGIDAAGPVEMVLAQRIDISCEYTMLGKLQNEIAKHGVKCGEAVYTESVTLPVFIPVSEADRFIADITDKTNGQAGIKTGETGYISI